MSFISSVIINLLEKELAAQTPEIEAMALKFIGHLSSELIQFVEKKTGIASQIALNPIQTMDK